MKTRFLAMLLAVLMIASSAFAASANFSDVAADYEHSTAVNTLAKLGIIGGYEDGTFKPNDPVERDEMAKLIFVLKTTFLDAGTGASLFTDTAASWANGYISYCYTEGIIGGYGDGRFGPDDNITYDQALKMACVALGYKDFSSAKWPTDVRLVGIKQLGLNAGLPSDLNGSDELTRGQVAQILYNALFVTMKETKTENKEVTIGDATFTVPVEVAMTLADDVWGFTEETATIVATSEIALGENALAKEDEVTLVYEDETTETYALADLGLEDYADKSYELIGRNISFFYLDDELIEGSALLKGSFSTDAALAVVKASNKADDTTKISIDGKKYNVADVWYEVAEGKLVAGTTTAVDPAKNFPKDKDNKFTNAAVSELFLKFTSVAHSHKEYMSITIDGDGDGTVDYLIVEAANLFKVDDITSKKVSGETTYTYKLATLGTDSSKNVAEADLYSDVELAEGDVVIGVSFGDNFFVKNVVEGQETYITRGNAGTKYLNSIGTITYANDRTTNPFYGQTEVLTNIPNNVGEKNTAGTYYVVGKYVAWYDGTATTTETIGTAVIFSAEGATDFTYNESTGSYSRYYPMTIVVDGAHKDINVQKINGTTVTYDSKEDTYTSDYANYMVEINEETGKAEFNYTFAVYELDSKTGLYNIYTDDKALEKITAYIGEDETQAVVAKDAILGYTASTGFYKLGNELFEMNDDSIIYYVDEEGNLAFYTAATMPKEFETGITSESLAYFTNADQYIKTLVAVMIDGSLTTASKSGVMDPANHLFFFGDGEGLTIGEDGYAHYVYRYINLATGELVETYSVLPSTGNDGYTGKTSVPMFNGVIGAYKADGQTLEVVVDAAGNVKEGAEEVVVFDTVTAFYESNNLIFLNNKVDGISVANAKIIEITSDIGANGVTEWVDFDADKTIADLAAAFKDLDDGEKLTIVYGWDAEDEEVVYVLYFDDVYPIVTEA